MESPSPHNVPYSLALFLASPKKKGEKEGRRSARGRFFHESISPGYAADVEFVGATLVVALVKAQSSAIGITRQYC